MDRIKKIETAKQIAELLAKNGTTYSEVPEIFDDVKNYLSVNVVVKQEVVYRDGQAYERKPYARDYTPVGAAPAESTNT